MGILTTLVREVVKNNSERPVDALAANGKLPTHLLTTSNQEMLAHLKTDILRSAALALTVSKGENFDQFFQWNMTLWYSKHILSHCEGFQKCIFNAFSAAALPLSDQFVTEQQDTARSNWQFL